MSQDQLLEFLDNRAGERHRGTVLYDGDDTDVLYLRDDLKQVRLTSQIDRMLRRLRPESSPKETDSFPLGRLKATVRLFEEAIVLHFPRGRDHGLVVSLEPETARQLNSFIGECETRIQS